MVERQTKVLSNSALGIDFNQLSKPTNLKNSAVLKMLEEEEERKKAEQAGLKRIAWPPPPEGENYFNYIEQGPIQVKDLGIWNHKPHFQFQQKLLNPIFSTSNDKLNQTLSIAQDQQPSHHFYKPDSISLHFEPPPSIIRLRQEPPISQQPLPVYQAQPAATHSNSDSMRGDFKWPPALMKEQAEVENHARIELAKGPICRPRRINKDYSSLFAQYTSTNNYPSYRAPPGTQYFVPTYHH